MEAKSGGKSFDGKPMAATFSRPGSVTVLTGRSAPLIFRTDDWRISAARLSASPAPTGISIAAAARPLSTKTKARAHGLDGTGLETGLVLGVSPGAQAAAQRSAAATIFLGSDQIILLILI
ncbi:MAG: hypothetical protein ABSG19_13535 [Candidatus Aminicenantales bacterium]